MEHTIVEYKAYSVKVISPSDFKGTRILIKDKALHRSKYLPFDYNKYYLRTAIEFLSSKGIVIKGLIKGKGEDLLITDDFSKTF